MKQHLNFTRYEYKESAQAKKDRLVLLCYAGFLAGSFLLLLADSFVRVMS